MQHKGTVALGTERLFLRRFEVEDAPQMYANWCGDPEVSRYTTWEPHPSADASRQLLELWTSEYGRPDCYNWVIGLKESGELVGSLSVVRVNDEIDELELGWCLGRRWWGRGIMPEAAGAVVGYLFDEVGANRLSAKHDVENGKSGRVMQKIGMQFEGVRRQGFRGNRGIVDVACYSILRSDRGGEA